MSDLKSSLVQSMKIKDWIVLIAVTLLAVLVYSASLDAKLDVRQDDHRILFFSDSNPPQHEQLRNARDQAGNAMAPTVSSYLESDKSVGRFRPLTQVAEVAMPRAFGVDPFRLHLLILLLTALTSISLFHIGFKLGGSSLEGTALVIFVLLAPDPGPSKVWYYMSVKAELLGTLFTLFAVLSTMKAARSSLARDEILPLVMLAVAMLFKEPFALLLPAMLAMRLVLPFHYGSVTNWREIPRVKLFVFGYLILAVAYSIALWIGISSSPKDSYGTQSLHDLSQLGAGLSSIFRQLPMQAVLFLPLLLSTGLLVWRVGVARTAAALAPPVIIALSWVLPQVLLYAARGGMWDHYWLPALLGIAGLNVWCMRLMRLDGSRTILAFALLVSFVWAANGIRTNYFAVQNYVRLTQMRNEAADALITRVPEKGVVVIVADYKVYSEYATSWLYFAANKGKPATQYLLYDTNKPNSPNFTEATFFPHTPKIDSISACRVDAVIFLSEPAETDAKWKDWYKSECFAEKTFVADLHYFSLRKMNITSLPFQLTVAFHKPLR